MQILQKYFIEGAPAPFDTIEEAQNYVDNNADQMRVKAFIEHLLATTDRQRVSSTVTDTVEAFIAFEKAQDAKTAEGDAVEEALGKSSTVTTATTPESTVTETVSADVVDPAEDGAPWTGDDTVKTGEEQEAKVEDTKVTDTVSGEVKAEKASALSGLTNTEKSTNLFLKKA